MYQVWLLALGESEGEGNCLTLQQHLERGKLERIISSELKPAGIQMSRARPTSRLASGFHAYYFSLGLCIDPAINWTLVQALIPPSQPVRWDGLRPSRLLSAGGKWMDELCSLL